jgi:L-seryl-tRNA(Ser) seleniumtransferase
MKAPPRSALPSLALRALPRVDEVAQALPGAFPRSQRVHASRQSINALRNELQADSNARAEPESNCNALEQTLLARAVSAARAVLEEEEERDFPPAVLNATGIIVHTGLGRSRLSRAATEAAARAARDGCALEVDVDSGERGHRDATIARMLREITGCEDATVLNNGAGATLLALSALCAGARVACSRGELVEIGGGFRMPDVMAQSGAVLIEVGCTNKTRASDYRSALLQVLAPGHKAGLLKVHPSNFHIEGFTEEVPIGELAALARELSVPLIDDLGSGALIDLAPFGLRGEPTVQEHVASGADAVIFSGDKLLGGPQCGVICGRGEAIGRIRRHPLARALRCDKMTLAALSATLRAYANPDGNFSQARREIPTLQALTEPVEAVRRRADRLARRLRSRLDAREEAAWRVSVQAQAARAGAGSLPAQELPSWSVVLEMKSLTNAPSVEEAARRLRCGVRVAGAPGGRTGVWGRVQRNGLWLDARCLRDEDVQTAVQAVAQSLAQHP